MHGPVDASRFTELTGAVERVDDPDALGGQSRARIVALLRKQRVGASLAPKCRGQEVVRSAITRVLERPYVAEAEFVAKGEQQFARLLLRRLPQYGRPSLPKYGQPWVSDALPSSEIDKAVGWLLG